MPLVTEILLFTATFITISILTRALRKKSDSRRYPPSMPSLPLVGSLPFIRNFEKIHEFFMSKADQLGPIFTFRAGPRLCLILSNREVMEEALVKNSSCFAGREMFYVVKITNQREKGIGEINFGSDFKRYHKLSLSVLREFGFGKNRLMETRILQEFQAMDDFIRTKNGVEFDPSEIVGLATYNVMRNIVLGNREDYDNGLDEILKNFILFFGNATAVIDVAPGLLKCIPYFGRKVESCIRSMSRICEIIDEDIEKLRENGRVECFVTSYLARVGPDYDREQLIYTVRDLISAGFETTTTTLLWLLVLLANNPSTMERLQKDIDAVIPRNRLPSLDDQPKLPFFEATILEALRFRTVLPLSIPRLTLSDSEVCGYFIPANTKVIPNLYAAHMNPKLWKDPDVFRPERFLDNEDNLIGQEEMISFSMGRRACLGEILARQEMFLFFAGWMQRFNIQLGEGGQKIDEKPVVKITIKPRPFKIRMIPRDNGRTFFHKN